MNKDKPPLRRSYRDSLDDREKYIPSMKRMEDFKQLLDMAQVGLVPRDYDLSERMTRSLILVRKNPDLALDLLNKELAAIGRTDPQQLRSRIFSAMGEAQATKGNYNKALELYREAISEVEDPRTLNQYSLALMALIRFDEAMELQRTVLSKDSSNLHARLGLGNSHFYKFEYEAAIKEIEEGLEKGERVKMEFGSLSPLARFYYGLGGGYKGAVQEAKLEYLRWMLNRSRRTEDGRAMVGAHYNLAQCYDQIGDRRSATKARNSADSFKVEEFIRSSII